MLQWVLWSALVVAVVVGLGLLLSRGRLGELPDLVDDRPQPRIPEGDFVAEDLDRVWFALAGQGYQHQPVDDLLTRARQALEQGDPALADEVAQACVSVHFPVTRNGYQMGQVDAVLDKLAHQLGVAAMAAVDESDDGAGLRLDAQAESQTSADGDEIADFALPTTDTDPPEAKVEGQQP